MARNFTNPVPYTVTAEDGSTATYTVTVTVASASAKAITGFAITSPPATGVINEGAKTIAVTVPYGTSVTSLVPTITHTGESISPLSGTAQDFASPVTYTVTAADGSAETYTVTVTVASAPANTEAKITGFGFDSITPPVTVVINEAAKTIKVTVPSGTSVTSLTPTITVSAGASVSPVSGAAQNFTSPVTYTVTAEDGVTQAAYTVTVTVAPSALTNTGDIATYLSTVSGGNTADDAIPLPVDMDLSGTGWQTLLTEIATAGKYVALDLSDCDMAGTEFDPAGSGTGRGKIVSLVLPDDAESIKGNTSSSTFQYFDALTSVSGENIETIGYNAFYNCAGLTSVDFPATKFIMVGAFSGCASLTSVELPAVEEIGNVAFYGCTSLTSVSLSASLSVMTNNDGNPFANCPSLTNITVDPGNPNFKAENGMLLNYAGTRLIGYPAATGAVTVSGITIVNREAFRGCPATSVSLPNATTIGMVAFLGCTALSSVSLPAATSIGQETFGGCTALETLDLSSVTNIGYGAFASTGTQTLTVTLGGTVPTLETDIFYGITTAKIVIVKVPAGTTAYGTPLPLNCTGADTSANWGNGFRGGGWNGTLMEVYSINSYIDLTIEEL